MKKYRLEDLKKDKVFTEPPSGYFDKLPGLIQARVTEKTQQKTRVFWIGALKLVPAAAVIVLIAVYTGLFNSNQPVVGVEQILSEVSTDEIILYLEEMDITNAEILAEVDLSALPSEFGNRPDPLIDNLEIEDEALLELYDDFDIQDSLL